MIKMLAAWYDTAGEVPRARPARQHLFLRCDMKIINRLICHFKGHKGLQRGQEYTSIYQEIKGCGAFGRGFPYVYEGRLYRCSRCGELRICRGVTSWEIEDLISDTLKDLPKNYFEDMWSSQDYNFRRFYK